MEGVALSKGLDAMRVATLPVFQEQVGPLTDGALGPVAVVGGSQLEPELAVLESMGVTWTAVHTFGVDGPVSETNFYLDLNEADSSPSSGYDLTLCSQVLEHVWDLAAALSNLSRLVHPERGLLWITCPTSNFYHLSPDFFSAGYTPEALTNLISRKTELQVFAAGCLGSEREYQWRHRTRTWPTAFAYRFPLLSALEPHLAPRERVYRLRRQASHLVPLSLMRSKVRHNDLSVATDTWVLAGPRSQV